MTDAPRPTRDDQPDRREIDALFAFSRKLVAAAGIGDIAQTLLRTVDDLVHVDAALLLLLENDPPHLVACATLDGVTADRPSISIALDADRSALAQVVRDHSSHRILDGARESLHNREIADALGLISAVYVPLVSGDSVVGVLVAGTTDALRAYRLEEVELVQKLADDAAVAIERARFAQQLREVGERDLIVAQVARQIRESLDPAHVLKTSARELGEQSDADRVEIRVPRDEEIDGGTWTWTPSHSNVAEYSAAGTPASAGRALEELRACLGDTEAGTDRELSVPLVQRGQVLGAVTLHRASSPFDTTEVRLIELIAVEISAAFEYGRVYQGSRAHLDQQLALARAAQALTADLRFDRVLERIVSEVVKVLPMGSATFYVYDRDQGELTLSAAFGDVEEQVVGSTVGLVGLAGRVVQAGVSQYTNHYQRDSGDLVIFEDVTRAVAVPVRWQGDLRGVIAVVARDDGRPFGQRDVSLLEAFADLASLALHNAEAYSANSRQARIQAGFYRIAQVFSSSLSRSETLEALAQAAAESLDGDFSIVVGGLEELDALHVEGDYAAPPELLRGLTKPELLHESPAPLAVHHRRVVTARTVATDTRLGERWRAICAEHGVVSQLAVPVAADGERTAVVVVCFRRQVRFGDEELVVASNLASAAGAALERAGLFENERRTRRLAEVLADVSSMIAETLKTQTVLERIVDQAAVLLGVEACTLAVAEQTAGPTLRIDDTSDRMNLAVHAAAGHDEPLVVALRNAAVGGLVEEVARTKRPEFVAELASETSAQSLDTEHYDSYLGVPMLHPRGHLIGVLSVYARHHRRWEAAEISALESFASSAAIAIRNAELYADIKRQRDTVEKLVSSIAEGIVATDAAGRVTLWNQAAEQITGLPRHQVVGRAWRDALGFASDTVIPIGTNVVEARPTGVPTWLSITASPLRDRGGVHGSIYAFRDVSAHYTLDRLKSDFVSTVSYVLRTPLTSIYGFAQTLLREDLEFSDADKRVFLEYIATETERLTGIVDDLLQASQIDAGSVKVQVADCDVDGILDAVLVAAREQAPENRIELADSASAHLRARADAEKLQTVIANLVDNAVQFSPPGGTVRIGAQRDNGSVHISVTDSGMGIAPSEQNQLFTKFYVSPQAGEVAGSGLGLYISKGLITAMGGRIGVSSQVGAGSTFTVELPAATGADSAPAVEAS